MGTLLSRYVDGELAEKERKSIETHLETCASCRDVLNLFQRNDNVLNNALVGEAFGAQTVDAVMTEIRRLEEPMVVAPVVDEEPAPAPVAMRQVIEVTRMWPFAAAAALMIACVGGFLAVAKYGGFGASERVALEKQIDRMHRTWTETMASSRIATQAIADRARELSQELRDAEVRANLRWAKESTGLAYVNDQSIVVQANFSPEKFHLFMVFRAKEVGGGRYEPWSTLRDNLPTPYYKDTAVEPGVNYTYQIRAIYRNPGTRTSEDSVPMVMMLPLSGGLDPRRCLRVRFIAALPDSSQATFEVSRYDNEKLISHYYNVKVGEKIGDVQSIDGADMDFSTRYTLHSIVGREEVITDGKNIMAARQSRHATLKGDPKARDLLVSTLTIMLERDQLVPLPK
jgi:hypothetical protein